MNSIQENYERWLSSPLVSEEDKKILRAMSKEEIDDAFYQDVEFGTGGMRGVLGPGKNRIISTLVPSLSLPFSFKEISACEGKRCRSFPRQSLSLPRF